MALKHPQNIPEVPGTPKIGLDTNQSKVTVLVSFEFQIYQTKTEQKI